MNFVKVPGIISYSVVDDISACSSAAFRPAAVNQVLTYANVCVNKINLQWIVDVIGRQY